MGNKAKEFLSEYWPEIAVLVAGMATVTGAIIVVSRYIRHSRELKPGDEEQLKLAEQVPRMPRDPTATLIEEVGYMQDLLGDEVSVAAAELAPELQDRKLAEVVETMGDLAQNLGRKKR